MNMKELAVAMLTENTGRHFLDSGGAYGRNWERNQGRDFEAEKPYSVRWWCYEHSDQPHLDMEATVSLYHWLVHNFEPDDRLQRMFDTFAELNPDMVWLELAEEFAALLSKHTRYSVSSTTNTYNEENDLSQIVQYVALKDGEDYNDVTHVILQVHGGCDARGGYGKPMVLKLNEEAYEMYDTQRVQDIYTSGCSPMDTATATLPGIKPKEAPTMNRWFMDGYRSIEPDYANECKEDLFKLFCAKDDPAVPIAPRAEWWVIVTEDHRAFLMAPGMTEMHDDLELHAGGFL